MGHWCICFPRCKWRRRWVLQVASLWLVGQMVNIPPDLRRYEKNCHKAIMEERFKPCHGSAAERTYRHRMAEGMLQAIYQAAHKRKLRDRQCLT